MMAEMKKIFVEELKPGTVFSDKVYIDHDTVFLEKDVPFTEENIKKLMKWGITEVETRGEANVGSGALSSVVVSDGRNVVAEYENLLSMRKKLIEVHGNACDTVGKIYSAIRKDEEINFSGISAAVDSIIDLMDENEDVFLFLGGLEDMGQNYFVTHSVNVTFYALLIAKAMNYTQEQKKELGVGTILIDAGMVQIPAYITNKQSNLTSSEFKSIKAHPLYGYKLLVKVPEINEKTANISLQHHEQFDGSGYPRGLKGKDIDEYARIASIADSYEAQTAKRTYREKVGAYHAMKNLLAGGVQKFDPDILKLFLAEMSVYPIGSLVRLNDDSLGLVVGSIREKPLRPSVKLIRDAKGNKVEGIKIVKLVNDSSKFISSVLSEKEAGIDLFDVLWDF